MPPLCIHTFSSRHLPTWRDHPGNVNKINTEFPGRCNHYVIHNLSKITLLLHCLIITNPAITYNGFYDYTSHNYTIILIIPTTHSNKQEGSGASEQPLSEQRLHSCRHALRFPCSQAHVGVHQPEAPVGLWKEEGTGAVLALPPLHSTSSQPLWALKNSCGGEGGIYS